MEICKESIDAHKKILENPKEYGFDFPALKECFEHSDVAVPKHILFKEYIELIKVPLQKVFFYIIMDGLYQVQKAPDGNLGYTVRLKK